MPPHKESLPEINANNQESRVKDEGDGFLWTSFQHLDLVMPDASASHELFHYVSQQVPLFGLNQFEWDFLSLVTPKT